MRFLLLSVCLLTSFITYSRQIVSFYGSKKQQNNAAVIKPAIMFSDSCLHKEYSVDIGFTVQQKQSVLSGLAGLFTTQRGAWRFLFPGRLPALDDHTDHHLVFSRQDNYIRVYLDGNMAASWYDEHNLLDIRFPWFNLEFSRSDQPIDLLKVNGVMVSAKPFHPAEKKQTIQQENVVYTVYPNPATNAIHLQSQLPVTHITVYNSIGMEMINRDLNSVRGLIPVQHLPPGMYTMKIFHRNKITGIRKFIKQ